MYRGTPYPTHRSYITSSLWQEKKAFIIEHFPLSRYCYICDCTKALDLHHEGYEAVPFEQFYIDLFWLCSERCHNCHFTVQLGGGTMLYEKAALKQRRLHLRKRYVLENLRPSTLLRFLWRFFYRLLY